MAQKERKPIETIELILEEILAELTILNKTNEVLKKAAVFSLMRKKGLKKQLDKAGEELQ